MSGFKPFSGAPVSAFGLKSTQPVSVVTRLGPGGYPVALTPTVAAGVSLTPSLVDSDDAFYAPTVAAGVSLTPSLVDSDDAFYAPVTAPGSITVTPDLIDDADAVHTSGADVEYAPVLAGYDFLLPTFFASDDTVYVPVALSNYELSASLYDFDDSFYVPTAVAGDVGLDPSLYQDSDVFDAPTASAGAILLEPVLLDADDVVSSTAVSSDISVVPSLVASDDSVYASEVSTVAHVLHPDVVGQDDEIFSLSLGGATVLQPFLHHDLDSIWVPVDAANYEVSAPVFASDDLTFTGVITTGPVSVLPSWLVDPEVFDTPFVAIQKKNGQGGGGSGGSVPKNLKYATKITMTDSGLLVALEADSSASQTINTRMAVYSDAGGLPGALLAQSAVQTSVVSGANTYPLLVPWAVLAGDSVWVALHSDGNFNWFLSPSPGGSKYNTDLFADGISNPFGPASTDNKKAPIFVIYLQSATDTMLPVLMANQDVFYSPSQSASSTILPPALADEDFVNPTSAQAVDVLQPSALSDQDVVGQASIGRGQVSLLPSLVLDSDIFINVDVGRGAGYVFPSLFPDDSEFYVADAATIGGALAPLLVVDDDVLSDSVAVSSYELDCSAVDDADVFQTSALTSGSYVLLADDYVDQDNFYDSDAVKVGGTLSPDLFVDSDLVLSALVGRKIMRRRVQLSGADSSVTLGGTRSPTISLGGSAAHVNLTGDWED